MSAERAGWALSQAFSRDDVGHFDWLHAAALLAGAGTLPQLEGAEARALELAMRLSADRLARLPKRAPLAVVRGEEEAEAEEILQFTSTQLKHGGMATVFVALAMRAAEVAGRPLARPELVRLIRVVRSNLAERELDRYLGAERVAPGGLSEDPGEALGQLTGLAISQLADPRPDQVHRGARVSLIGELVHGPIHAAAVLQLMRLAPNSFRPALLRLGEQLGAQHYLSTLEVAQQFEDLPEPDALTFKQIVGSGFDDPRRLLLACAGFELDLAFHHPEGWSTRIARACLALE